MKDFEALWSYQEVRQRRQEANRRPASLVTLPDALHCGGEATRFSHDPFWVGKSL
jgi:hypothetical protein